MSGAAARTGTFKKKRKKNIRNYKIRGEYENNTKTNMSRRNKKMKRRTARGI